MKNNAMNIISLFAGVGGFGYFGHRWMYICFRYTDDFDKHFNSTITNSFLAKIKNAGDGV